jgi:CRP/FNR family transcriptional regulator
MTPGILSCDISSCHHCPAREHSILDDLEISELDSISISKGSRTYERGDVIFYEGDYPSGVHCISQGRVKIYKIGGDGREQIVRLAGRGEMMGYRPLLSGESYGMFAEALEPVQLCHIPKATFLALLSGNQDFTARLMRLLAEELKMVEEKIVSMARKHVSERVAETLLQFKEVYGMKEDNATIDIELTRLEMANFIGSAMESVSRQLSKFSDDGIIDLVGRRIKILDYRALFRAANPPQ